MDVVIDLAFLKCITSDVLIEMASQTIQTQTKHSTNVSTLACVNT